MLSTRVGTWVPLKVRIDLNRELADRVLSVQRGTGDPVRAYRGIGTQLNSSNTVVVTRDDVTR